MIFPLVAAIPSHLTTIKEIATQNWGKLSVFARNESCLTYDAFAFKGIEIAVDSSADLNTIKPNERLIDG
jgi:hypothetical protein